MEAPPDRGEFRIFNQITQSISLNQIAQMVADARGGSVLVDHVFNPRVEQEDHYYKVVHTRLEQLGLQPHLLTVEGVRELCSYAERYRSRVDVEAMLPAIEWAGPLLAASNGR